MGLRWGGHVAFDESQPRWGFWPLGSLVWYRWFEDFDYFMVLGNQSNKSDVELSGRVMEFETEYTFKARVETVEAGDTIYSYKGLEEGRARTLRLGPPDCARP